MNPLCNNMTPIDTNNTTQETNMSLQSNNIPLRLATTYSSSQSQTVAYNSNYRYTHGHKAILKVGQDDIQGASNEDVDNCEHNYHVLEQPLNYLDNDYEELDKYEKKGRSQQEEEEDVNSDTVEGSAMEGEGPEGGVCTSTEEHDKSVLISKYGN